MDKKHPEQQENYQGLSTGLRLLYGTFHNLLDLGGEFNTVPRIKKFELMLRCQLPYRMDVNKDGGVLPINREYKPTGFRLHHAEYVDYDSVKELYIPQSELAFPYDSSEFAGLLNEQGYFYNDGNTPWGSVDNFHKYMSTLSTVFKLGAYVDPLGKVYGKQGVYI